MQLKWFFKLYRCYFNTSTLRYDNINLNYIELNLQYFFIGEVKYCFSWA